jgi:DNA-binding YbaB/EbfC family protein
MDLLKNASAIKEQLAQVQETLGGIVADGSSGGNMVRVTLNGRFDMTAIELDPICVDKRDIPMLQDLIVAAHRDAQVKLQEEMKAQMGPLFQGVNIPGLTL